MTKGHITRLLFVGMLFLVALPGWSTGWGYFQVAADSIPPDTVATVVEEEPAPPLSTSTAADTVPSVALDTISDAPSAASDPQPRIIYYQSEPDTDYRSSSVRTKHRGGKRVKTLAGSTNHSGGFGAISFKSTSFNDEALVMAGVRGGWIVNRTLAIGGEGYGIIPTAKLDGIATNQRVLALGGYGGMFLELIFFSNEVVHVTFPVGGGAGWIGYDPVNEGSNLNPPNDPDGDGLVDEDVFWYVEPGADLELNVARNFRLAIGASKRFTQDLELQNTDSDALEEWNFFVTLKIGSF